VEIDVARSAVLSLDMQAGVVSLYVKDPALLSRAAEVMRSARQVGVPVFHVKVGFRPGVPEASPRNIFLSAVKASPAHQLFFQGDSGAVHVAVAPQPGEVIVTKNRVNAFAGTDLDGLLRAHDIHTLILFGIATSGAVLATALHAADTDYRVIIVKDCCADLDEGVHACLVDEILPRQATVVPAVKMIDALIPQGLHPGLPSSR
jgi:nicotinamidase-related amidase